MQFRSSGKPNGSSTLIYTLNLNYVTYVKFKFGHSPLPKTFFLDSGAEISIIKVNDKIDTENSIYVKGITNNKIKSQGTLNTEIFIENYTFKTKLHVVNDNFSIPTDGILGQDFMKTYKCILNYENFSLTLNFDFNGPKQLKIPFDKTTLLSLIERNSDVFGLEDEPLSVNNFYKQKLKVTDEKPSTTDNQTHRK